MFPAGDYPGLSEGGGDPERGTGSPFHPTPPSLHSPYDHHLSPASSHTVLPHSSPIGIGDGGGDVLSAAWDAVDDRCTTGTWEETTVVHMGDGSTTDGSWQDGSTAMWEADGSDTCEADREDRWEAGGEVTTATSGAGGTGRAGQGRRRRRERTVKVYQWPPQQDPRLEDKRQRALREYHRRQQEDQEECQLRRRLANTNQQLVTLRQQVAATRSRVQALQTIVDQHQDRS